MGWWKVENTENLIGDQVLDILSSAVLGVVDEYQQKFGRRPTVAEWEALLFAILSAEEPDAMVTDGAIPTTIRIGVTK